MSGAAPLAAPGASAPAAAPRAGQPLARHYLGWLAALFALVEVITVLSVLGFVMFPMARRSADDLAGLLILSAHTWAALPAAQRPAFEDELARDHRIAVRPAAETAAPPTRHAGFYVRFLAESLSRREGLPVSLGQARSAEGEPWLWTRVRTGAQPVDVGFAYARMRAQPLWALAVALASGTLLVVLVAWWLARRIARPVAALDAAAEALARGLGPARLPETGPRELARLAAHFNAMAQQVQQMMAARTTLFAGLSHDLRTPLARMRLSLELLAQSPRPQRIAEMERDIEAMNTLIGQLLDLARGLHAAPAQTLALRPWLQDFAATHAAQAQAGGSRLTVHCPEGLQVHAAAAALGRVLDNLVLNALRHAPGPVELCAEATPQGCALEVRDRGPGVPADDLEALWQPFVRLEHSRSPDTGGCGLGLAIVRQIATAQGWQARLLPRAGGGLVARLEIVSRPAPSERA